MTGADIRGPAPIGSPADGPRDVPATSAQRGLWLSESLDRQRSAYVVVRAFTVEGPLDADALDRAVTELVRRHDALRTALVADGDALRQVVWPDVSAPVLRRHDLSGAEDPDVAASALVAAETDLPFDLGRAPLLRAWLAQLAPQRHVLCMTLHHAVIDERSLEILADELGTLYTGGPLPAAAQYSECAEREAAWLATLDFAQRLEQRRRELADAPAALALPELATGDRPGHRAGALDALLSEPAVARVVALGREHGATPFVALATVVYAVLYRWTGEPNLVVGVPASIRDEADAAHTVGLFINTVPVRTDWHDNPSWAQGITRVRGATLRALGARAVPFERLVASLPQLRVAGRAPVVQFAFGYSESGQPLRLTLPGVACRELPIAAGSPKFDLSIDCSLTPDGVRLTVEWDPRFLDEPLAQLLVEDLAVAFRHAAADPDAAVGDWPLHGGPDTDDDTLAAGALSREPAADAAWEAFVTGATI